MTSETLFDLSVANLITLDERDDAEPCELAINRLSTSMRVCYANEVKSAKELKIYLRQDTPLFFPHVRYGLTSDLNELDMRTKKPERIQTEQ